MVSARSEAFIADSGYPPRLVGRDDQLAALRGWLDAAIDGRGQVVVLEGEAGIGKTELVTETARQAEALGARVCVGTADPLDTHLPFGVMAAALGAQTPTGDPRLGELAALFSSQLAGDTTNDLQLSAGHRVMEAILELVDDWTLKQPLVLAVDNLQWADASSVAFLRQLARGVPLQPLLLLLTTRPSLPRDDVARLASSGNLLRVGPLEAAAVTELATGLLGARPGPRLSSELGRAGGNPLFVTELLAALKTVGDVRRLPGGEAEVEGKLPATSLNLAILRRISLLPDDVLEVLRLAAVLGRSFTPSDLSLLSGRSAVDLVGPLEAALGAQVLRSEGSRLAFRHDVIHAALHADLPLPLRRSLHRELGLRLARRGASLATVAAHLAEGVEPEDTEALAWLQRAGRALTNTSPLVAADLLGKVVSVMPEGPARASIEGDLAVALIWSGRYLDGEAMARQIAGQLRDPDGTGRVIHSVASSLLMRGDTTAARTLASRARRRSMLDLHHERLATCIEAASALFVGERATAERIAGVALHASERAGDTVAASHARILLTFAAVSRGRLDEALALAEETRRTARATERVQVVEAVPNLAHATVLLELDRIDDARRLLAEGREQAEQVGAQGPVVVYDFSLGFTGFLSGAWDDALADIATGMDNAGGWMIGWRSDALSVRALIQSERGLINEGKKDLAEAEKRVLRGEPAYHPQWLWLGKTHLAELAGDQAGALRALREGWRVATEAELPLLQVALGPPIARLAAAADPPEARQVTVAVEDVARANPGVARLRATARWCQALAEGDPAGLSEAAGLVSEGPRPLERAAAHHDAAVHLASAGRADEARTHAAAALAELERLQAIPRTRLFTSQLRAAGVRLGRRGARRRPTLGWDALTQTERTVAELVGDGLSNAEIATHMFLSRRTVETHVAHILSKVGCESKRDLARQVARRRA